MSHLSTIIDRVKRYEEMYEGDVKRMAEEPYFQQAVANLQEYMTAWDDFTEEEMHEADRLYMKYANYLMPKYKEIVRNLPPRTQHRIEKHGERYRIEKYGERNWAVYDGDKLVAVTVYLKGAEEVVRRLRECGCRR